MSYIDVALLVLLLIQGYLSYRERQQLVDRLMARDLTDFKASEPDEDNDFGEEDDDNLVPIEEARDDIDYGQTN